MTINDIELNAYCLKIRQIAEALPILMRNGADGDLWKALADIENHARAAGFRLNDVHFKDKWHPYRDSMGS
jgi:hypothetical protein